MAKLVHEIRDPIHVFIHLDSDERRILDSRPFQRLRHIHQLAMSYLVYPGATHRRFEHCLGVMELADRVFGVITREENRHERVRSIFPGNDQLAYWRRVLRVAALCHDLGHIPFSHAAEDLFPEGENHETQTLRIIRSDEMQDIWRSVTPPLRCDDIAKLAVGPRSFREAEFTDWEAILLEIIVGDFFGVDRIDYLLRDSLHTGVAYGKFDHFRLIDTLRILPKSDDWDEPTLGVESGGVESAEALLLARYFMYSQVYFHPVRRAYDLHLGDFLRAWLGPSGVPTDPNEFMRFTDNEVLVELQRASEQTDHAGHAIAKRLMQRGHSRLLYERNPNDVAKNPDVAGVVFEHVQERYPQHKFHFDQYRQRGSRNLFPVLARDRRIVSSHALSDVLNNVPVVAVDYVFAPPEIVEEARSWLDGQLATILSAGKEPNS